MNIKQLDDQLRELVQASAPEGAEALAEAALPLYMDRAFSGPHQVPDTPQNRATFEPMLKEVIRRALEPLMGTPAGIDQLHSAICGAAMQRGRAASA